MAERVGFEPTCGECPQTDFESYARLVVQPPFRAVSGRIVHRKTLKSKAFFRQMDPNPLLYRYFFKIADFLAFFARLQEVGKKMAR